VVRGHPDCFRDLADALSIVLAGQSLKASPLSFAE
jgi:hypothetical protein